jgi:hypothetical protein
MGLRVRRELKLRIVRDAFGSVVRILRAHTSSVLSSPTTLIASPTLWRSALSWGGGSIRRVGRVCKTRSMGTGNHTQQVAPLLWTPWYATELEDQDGIIWFWPIIQDVGELPDPELLPPLERSWQRSDLQLMQRYVSITRRLVATTVFRGQVGVRINVLGGTVENAVPADEVTLGFAALLRQLFRHNEEASFDVIRNVLARAAYESDAAEVTRILRQWKDAHNTLRKLDVHALLKRMARARGFDAPSDEAGSSRPFVSEQITPEDLVGAFLYGDHLHYGDGRELLQCWRENDAVAALMEVNMLADALMLAHFYAGFAGVARVVLVRAGHDPNA